MSTVIVEALVKNLSEGSVSFQYRKSNGDIRPATGTIKLDLIPEDARPGAEVKTDGPSVPYYDLDSKGWRSFRRDAIVTA